MSHVSFKATSNGSVQTLVNGEVIAVHPSERGAKIAASRLGHTFDGKAGKPGKLSISALASMTPEAALAALASLRETPKAKPGRPAKAVKAPKVETPRVELPSATILAAYDSAKALIDNTAAKPYAAADAAAKAIGFSGFYVLSKVANGIKFGAKTDAEKAELTAKCESFKETREIRAVTPSDDSESESARVARNLVAKAHGFDNYREVRRIVTGARAASAETKARAVICQGEARKAALAVAV